MAVRKDYTIDVLRLLDNLRALAEEPRTFLGLSVGYNPNEMVMQIEKIRASLPKEVKDASTLARETERIVEEAHDEANRAREQSKRDAAQLMDEAKAEAERILEQARLQQAQMIAESEVLKLAKAQSQEIRNAAERDSQQMKRGADRYAHDVLSNLESVVGRVLTTIERGKAEIVVSEGAATPTRERIKA